jgi:hypothetical protein
MQTLRHPVVAALSAALLLAGSALAADLTGSWKWTTQNRNGPQEVHATFVVKDGVLSGTVSGRMGDAPIGDASFQNGRIRFTVTREFNGNTVVIKYDGRFADDTITGTIERPGFNEHDAPMLLEWKATRVK